MLGLLRWAGVLDWQGVRAQLILWVAAEGKLVETVSSSAGVRSPAGSKNVFDKHKTTLNWQFRLSPREYKVQH